MTTYTVTWSDRTQSGAGTSTRTNVRMPHADPTAAAASIARRTFGDAQQYDRVHIHSIRQAR